MLSKPSIGAIFVDGGFDAARDFVLRSFLDSFGESTLHTDARQPQRRASRNFAIQVPGSAPIRNGGRDRADHDRVFECVVTHSGVELGHGTGKSKKAAESEAALAALKHLRENVPA